MKNTMTYIEMKQAVINAYANFNSSRLRELEQMDKGMFDDIIKELEDVMGITLKRFWEV